MNHAYASLLIHVIFATKGRRPAITPELAPRLHEYLGRQLFGRSIALAGS